MQIGPGLRAAVVRDLARSPLEIGGLKAYLGIGNVIPEAQIGHVKFVFKVEDIDRLHNFIAGDFDRFALAAIESFYRSREGGANLSYLGWRLLESYYASFFAAHALMRSLGGGVSHISGAEVTRLADLAAIYEFPVLGLQSGSVLFGTSDSSGEWKLTIQKSAKGNGVHDGFWRDFCDFLQRAAERAVADGLPDANDFLAASIEMSDAILFTGSGSASWLASIRNALNYRHELNVWFPYHKSTNVEFHNRRTNEEAELSFRLDLSRSKDTLQLFESVNAKIVHMLWDVAELFHSISRKSGHFGNRYSRLVAMNAGG